MSTIKVDTIVDEAGTGAPNFSQGATVTGNITATGTIGATGTVTGGAFSGSGAGLTGIPSAAITGLTPTFNPVAVTGATPSLDVGSYNFFDNGTLTADTTVSFASVPTNAQWQYNFTPSNIATPYDTSLALSGDQTVLSTNAQDTDTRGLFFKPDGLKMYHTGRQNDSVYEYNLSTAWDITTATYSQLFSVASQDTDPEDVHFSSDGIYMYILGQAGDDVNQYTLSTAWNVTTASYTRVFSVASQSTGTNGMTFNAAGTKMYTIEQTSSSVHEYTLSTAWNLSTASFLQSLVTGPGEAVAISPDGTLLFAVSGSGTLKQYTLSTAYDVTSGTLTSTVSLSVNSYGIHFKPDGLTMFVAGTDKVTAFSFVDLTTVTLPSAVVETPIALSSIRKTTYAFTTLNGGTTVNLMDDTPQSTGAGAIGTYTWGRPANDITYNFGSTATGVYPVGENSSSNNARWINGTWTDALVGTVLPGTWRCVSGAYGAGTYGFLGLWVRIL